jgi:hypothetical protein
LFIATPTAYAVTIGQNSTWPGYAARRMPKYESPAKNVWAVWNVRPATM